MTGMSATADHHAARRGTAIPFPGHHEVEDDRRRPCACRSFCSASRPSAASTTWYPSNMESSAMPRRMSTSSSTIMMQVMGQNGTQGAGQGRAGCAAASTAVENRGLRSHTGGCSFTCRIHATVAPRPQGIPRGGCSTSPRPRSTFPGDEGGNHVFRRDTRAPPTVLTPRAKSGSGRHPAPGPTIPKYLALRHDAITSSIVPLRSTVLVEITLLHAESSRRSSVTR